MNSSPPTTSYWPWHGRRKRGPEAEFDAIIAGVATQQESAAPDEPSIEITRLTERVDLLVADFGRLSDHKAASAEYIREFTTEVNWHRWTRIVVAGSCGVIVIALAALLIVVLTYSRQIFGDKPGYALTALIVACISGIVVITIAALRGAF
ncbi:hypothetical protein [Sphingomonas xinjiangensis]|uniref:Transmembrane protein n=1 Tax=Sphingomonas xinjiangensis TaxID=643568 RepID=A0A840YFG0_9SPHN|nr:hypothetical protein [Sphingomonas xinjiangensis]MBB5712187.1 hypothetical protein [Sphingomonas xinjiangensis]